MAKNFSREFVNLPHRFGLRIPTGTWCLAAWFSLLQQGRTTQPSTSQPSCSLYSENNYCIWYYLNLNTLTILLPWYRFGKSIGASRRERCRWWLSPEKKRKCEPSCWPARFCCARAHRAHTWSPMLSWPHLAAGPVGKRLARTMVGSMEPQPDSTITTPKISPLAFGTTTWNKKAREIQNVYSGFLYVEKIANPTLGASFLPAILGNN